MDLHQRTLALMEQLDDLKTKFDTEQKTMLKGMREKQATKAGWTRYRDCQKFFTNARKELNSATNDCLSAVNKPSMSKIKTIEARIQVFDDSWQIARQYSMIGLLSG